MRFFTWFSQPKQSAPPPHFEMRHFMRIIHCHLDHEIQLVDDDMFKRAKDAYHKGEFFRFSSQGGRQFTVNFRQIQAVRFSVMPEITSSSEDVEYGQVYMAYRDSPLIIHAEPEELSRFLDSLCGDRQIVGIDGWQFDKHEIVLAIAGG